MSTASTPATVLLAEDDDSFRVFCRMSFAARGFSVVEAANGVEAIERALDSRPAAILLDLRLRGIGGRDVLRILRENREFDSVPILMVSAAAEAREGEGLLEEGADEVVARPVAPSDLAGTVERRIARGRRGPGETDAL